MNFVGALAYADDIVLLAPSPSAMRILLQICDSYAAEYDINFNPAKSKFLVIPAQKRRHLYSAMCNCSFYVGNKKIDNVDRFSHLGHIITSSLVDNDDIVQRRNTFVGQTNNVLCFFNKLNTEVKLKLFKSYCSSMYGAELWALNSAYIETFCVAWRKALRRILLLPYNCHSYFLPILSDTLPVYDEICKRSLKFIASSLVSSSQLVKSIARYCIMFGRNNSVLGTNALVCCDRYNWSLSELVSNPEQIKYFSFNCWYFNNLSDTQKITSGSLLELLAIRDGQLFLPRLFFTCQQLDDIIEYLCTS
jgi:hypothetical protein